MKILSVLLALQLFLLSTVQAAGKIQDADVKSLTELTAAGAGAAQLINDSKIYVTANSINQQLSTAISGGLLGGGGAGSISYVSSTNSTFEFGTPTWGVYANTAGVAPINGTGGSPTVTFAATASTGLRGTKVGRFTKTAVNSQGQGFSVPVTIDSADQGRLLKVSMDYSSSANYVDGDIRFYMYDITNSALIEIVDRDVNANSFGRFIGTFQASSNSTSYRLIGHVSSTSALAYTLDIDNVVLGPYSQVKGAVVTDWQSYTPVITSLGTTPTNVNFFYRRVGANIEVRGKFSVTATPAASEARISLPAGYTSAGTAKYPTLVPAGIAGVNASTSTWVPMIEPSVTYFTLGANVGSGAGTFTKQNGNAFAAGAEIAIHAVVECAGLSSNQLLSEDIGGRQIVGRFNTSTTGPSTTLTAVFSVKDIDTVVGYNSGTGEYTLPETGYYTVNTGISAGLTLTTAQALVVQIRLANNPIAQNTTWGNGTNQQYSVNVSSTFYGTKGQVVTVVGIGSVAITLSGGANLNHFSINKESTPQTIAGSETVAVRAVNTAGQSFAGGGSSTIGWDTAKVYDTHNALNASTGIFTSPVSGYYAVDVKILWAATTWSSTQFYRMDMFKNGSIFATDYQQADTTGISVNRSNKLSEKIYLAKGDTLYVGLDQSRGAATSLISSAGYNSISITKVGN